MRTNSPEALAALSSWELHPFRTRYFYKDTQGTQVRFSPPSEDAELPVGERWYVELNHYGWMDVSTGIRLERPEQIRRGLRLLEYAADKQLPDGSFPEKSDLHHSVAFFFEVLARLLILRELPTFRSVIPEALAAKFRTVLERGALWFSLESSWNDAHWKDALHHRFLLNASVLLLAERALGRIPDEARALAHRWIRIAIERQRPDGVNTENGGHDTGYQSLGVTFGAGMLLVCDLPEEVDAALRRSVHRAALWLAGRIRPDGTIDDEGNTRIGSATKEIDRGSGLPKRVKPYEHGFALFGASLLFEDASLRSAVERIEKTEP